MNNIFNLNKNHVRTHEKNNNKNTTTKRTYATLNEISYPQLFYTLTPDQKRDVQKQLRNLPTTTQQNILNEWQARCLMQEIRNPAAYLFGMIKKAKAGEFRVSEMMRDSDV